MAFATILGQSPAIQRARALADRCARGNAPVLLVGETGTGKEVFARHIHDGSGMGGGFVDVNCAAIPDALADGLLLGYRRGAFTGAFADTPGYVQDAEGGTLFLDEVLSLPPAGQARLLRVLETGEVRPLGARAARHVRFRAIAAAQEDLDARLHRREFRHDLYHRLAVVVIRLPPLRERPEDLMPLATHFAAHADRRLAGGAARVLLAHDWPGNVRELRTVIRRAAIMSDEVDLDGAVLAEAIGLGARAEHGTNGHVARLAEERQALVAICAAHGWYAQPSAAALGISRATLFRRLKAAGVSLREARGVARY